MAKRYRKANQKERRQTKQEIDHRRRHGLFGPRAEEGVTLSPFNCLAAYWPGGSKGASSR
jgi:hypothetical protein